MIILYMERQKEEIDHKLPLSFREVNFIDIAYTLFKNEDLKLILKHHIIHKDTL